VNAMPIKSYQELFAWQKAMDLAEETYHVTRDFPVEEHLVSLRSYGEPPSRFPQTLRKGTSVALRATMSDIFT